MVHRIHHHLDHALSGAARAAAGVLVACVLAGAACAPTSASGEAGPAARRPSSTSAPPRPMPDSTAQPPAAATGQLDVGGYLRGVANALAARGATPDAVLAAARAQAVQRGRDFAEFRVPDARFGDASLTLGGVGGGGDEPGSLTFDFPPEVAAVRLAEVERAFGSWRPGTPGPGGADVYPVVFADAYRPSAVRTSGGASVHVRASMSGDPARADARVVRLLLRRDPD